MTGVALLLVLGGSLLVYGAFKGLDPRSLITSVFTGAPPEPLPAIPGKVAPGDTLSGIALTGGSPPGGESLGNITAPVAAIIAAVKAKFPDANIGGTYVCRNVAGSSTPSQHAWGNAVDITRSSTPRMAALSAWAVAQARAGRLPIAQVLWWGKDQLHGGTVGGHRDHVHLTGSPQMTGIPPCMSRTEM